MNKYYKTVYTVEVLSIEPLELEHLSDLQQWREEDKIVSIFHNQDVPAASVEITREQMEEEMEEASGCDVEEMWGE